MMDGQNMLPKREALESLLAQGDVLLQLDPRVEGVRVPTSFAQQSLLVLRIGLEMPIPILDLVVDDDGITATLSFDRTPHEVALPWQSVFGMVTEQGQGLLWTADVPLEIIDQMLHASPDASALELVPEPKPKPKPKPEDAPPEPALRRPQLVALDGGLNDPDSTPPTTPPTNPGSAPPSLRVIK